MTAIHTNRNAQAFILQTKTISMRFLFVLLLMTVGLLSELQAQYAVGTWREHLPYGNTIDVAYGNRTVYCATPFAVFAYNKDDQSIQRISKVNKLSGSDISAIAFDEATRTLLVGYQSGNLDILIQGAPFRLSDIANSGIFGDKRVNDITVVDGLAYLSCGFGVVVVDILQREVRETWFLEGQNNLLRINTLAYDDTYWFAGTENGLYRAERSDAFLVSFEAWEQIDVGPLDGVDITEVMLFEDKLFVVFNDGDEDSLWMSVDVENIAWNVVLYASEDLSDLRAGDGIFVVCESNGVAVYEWTGEGNPFEQVAYEQNIDGNSAFPAAALIDEENICWVANEGGGLLNFEVYSNGQVENSVLPNGPPAFNVRRIDAFNDNIWIASGGVDATWTNNYDKKGIYGLVNDRWVSVEIPEGENNIGSINDFMSVSVNPLNNDNIALGTWEEGLVEVGNGEIIEIYNETDSPLELVDFGGSPRLGVAGVDFDEDGNLWFSNAYNDNSLMVQRADGVFQSWDLNPEVSSDMFLGDVVAARQGYIWAIAPRGNGIVVLNTNETLGDQSDDEYRLLTAEEGNGGLPTNDVYSLEEDLDNEMWVGTLQGIAVFYSPEAIFNSDNFDAQQILIEQGGNIQILLETEQVNCIEIDGANRKWVGTENNGVFLLSEDGLNQIVHFTEENSPLLSNTIFDIAINQRNGEVFFGTSRGITSYVGTATNFDQDIESVTVYPNPVREDYTGNITIDGLAYETDVKVTDASGNLVFSTTSFGGRAIWDGTGPDGKRVSTGVYLVFCSTDDGSATNVAKVAVIR
jgi:hypothetical protein